MDNNLLENNLKSIDSKDFKVFSEIDNEIKSLLKTQCLMEYHVVRNTLVSIFSKSTHPDIKLSLHYQTDLMLGDSVAAHAYIDKPEDLITSFDKEAASDTGALINNLFSTLHFSDVRWYGKIKDIDAPKFNNFPLTLDSLPLIDELILSEELNKAYQKSILAINLPEHDTLTQTKKMKI